MDIPKNNPKQLYDYLDSFIYPYYQNTIEKEKNGEKIDFDELKENLLLLDSLYGIGEKTPLSDEEYDILHSVYNSHTGTMITGDASSGNKIEHDYPTLKGTIEKVHYITRKEKQDDPDRMETHKVLEDWVYNTFALVKHYSTEPDNYSRVLGFYPKYDGMSVILSLGKDREVIRAITRGDLERGVGQDKTYLFRNFKLVDELPKEVEKYDKVGLKIEVVVDKDDFVKYNSRCCNNALVDERAAAASLLNSSEFTEVHKKYFRFVPLMAAVHESGHEISVPFREQTDEFNLGPTYAIRIEDKLPYNLPEVLTTIIEKMKEQIDKLNIKCDGVVVRWIDMDSILRLGRNSTSETNNFEIAYKFPKKSNYTRLIDIRQDIGYLGAVSYTAIFEPFEYNGRTVKHASLGSKARMEALKLAKGDLVNVKYEIIPYLIVDAHCRANKSGNPPIEPITECPYCHHEIVNDPLPRCVNPECPCRTIGRIYNFCQQLRIANIGPAVVETLYNAGILRSIEDLFRLKDKKDEITALDSFGEIKFNKIVKAIENLNPTEVELLGALGIPGVRLKRAKVVLNIYYLDNLLKMSRYVKTSTKKLTEIRTIGHKFARNLLLGIAENKELIEFLLKTVNLRIPKKSDGELGDVLFTGFRNPKFAGLLESGGYAVANNPSSRTVLVIAKNPEGTSAKIAYAKEHNIPVLGVEEAYVKFGYKF